MAVAQRRLRQDLAQYHGQEAAAGGFEITSADAARKDPPAELDPLPGVRSHWLEGALAQHAFVVLVFYRGFW